MTKPMKRKVGTNIINISELGLTAELGEKEVQDK